MPDDPIAPPAPASEATRLTSSDKRTLLLWVALGIIGLLFANKYYFRAFPEASVNFQISRAEAVERAKQFVTGTGADVNGYQSTIVFDVADGENSGYAKTYLERSMGLQDANRLMSTELNIWYWDVRFFRPQQEEEFHVRVSPAGKIVGYFHKVPEAAKGASPGIAEAQAQAERFLRDRMGYDLSAWTFLPEEANSQERPNRLDWSFTWEKRGFRAKDAPYRLRVQLDGSHVDGSEEFLQVPEAWIRSYKQLRSTNIFYNQVAVLPYIFLFGAALWLGIAYTRKGQTSWGPALKLGAVVAVLLFFMQLNQWPLARAGYNTNSSYGSFVLEQIAGALLFGIGSALMVVLVLPAAEPLYRASEPRRVRLAEMLTWRGVRSKEFFSATVVGVSLAAAHIGFIVAFYIVASHFGAWAPQDLNYQDSINTAIPWIAGVAIGLLAATSEEFLFRLFAIPFLHRLTRSKALAVILPAFFWSFLHSAYPQEPPYIRGLEVGLIGIVAGLVMLRWGIFATLTWHYTVDASLVGLLLIRSNSLYFKVSGIIVALAALAPLGFAAIAYLAKGKFEAAEDLRNDALPAPDLRLESAPAQAETGKRARRYRALGAGAIAFLLACLVAGGVAAWKLKQPQIGDYLKATIDAKQAEARASSVLRQRGVDPGAYHTATLLVDATDPYINEYLRRRESIAKINEIYAAKVPGALWRVRFFRDGETEEYAVILAPDGALHSVWHVLKEADPGASLDKDAAAALAEKYLRDEKHIDLENWKLVTSDSTKRPHRVDHTLTWEEKTPLDSGPAGAAADDHAYKRIEVQVLGNEVTRFRTFIKIPDEWRRKQEEQSVGRTLYRYLVPQIVLLLGILLTALILLMKRLRSDDSVKLIPWRRMLAWALPGLAGFVLVFAFGNRIATFLMNYPTTIPLKFLFGGMAISVLFGVIIYFGGSALLFGVAWYFANRAFGGENLPGWLGMPGKYYRDALCIGLGGAAGLLGLERFLQWVSAHWPTWHQFTASNFGQELDTTLPVGSVLGGTVLHAILLTALIALLGAFIAAEVRKRWVRLLLFVLGAFALVGSGWGGPPDFAKQLLFRTVFLAVIVIGVQRLMRLNVLSCFLVIVYGSLVAGLAELLVQPNAFYKVNAYALIACLAAFVLWPLLAWRTRPERAAEPAP